MKEQRLLIKTLGGLTKELDFFLNAIQGNWRILNWEWHTHICTLEDICGRNAGIRDEGRRPGENQDLVMVQVCVREATLAVRRGRITNTQEVDLLRQERARMQDKKLMPIFVVWATNWWQRDSSRQQVFEEMSTSGTSWVELCLPHANRTVHVKGADHSAWLTASA